MDMTDDGANHDLSFWNVDGLDLRTLRTPAEGRAVFLQLNPRLGTIGSVLFLSTDHAIISRPEAQTIQLVDLATRLTNTLHEFRGEAANFAFTVAGSVFFVLDAASATISAMAIENSRLRPIRSFSLPKSALTTPAASIAKYYSTWEQDKWPEETLS